VDFHGQVGDANVNALLNALKGMTDKLLVLDEKEVSLNVNNLLYNFDFSIACNDYLAYMYFYALYVCT
jgi:hypothetical protein